jgi:oligopeptide transport system ATP-binding protein
MDETALLRARLPALLDVEDLKVHFPVRRGVLRRAVGAVKAVDGVTLRVAKGEVLGLVGESGCGKSTTGLAVLRMVPVAGGRIRLDGHDITGHDPAAMRPFRRRMQMVYQDPFSSLDPRMTVADIVAEPLDVHRLHQGAARAGRIADLLDMVGLAPAMAERYPHEFSGGQRQRIGIARALAIEPDLVICDEPVSALDVSIQAQIINLFQELQERLGLSYLFIAHDLAVVRHVSDRIAVMYLGKIVEQADRDELYARPLHPYTQALLAAVPIPNPAVEARRPHQPVMGEVPSAENPPSGCRFHPRCAYATEQCRMVEPAPRPLGTGEGGSHMVACHLY